MADIEAAMLAFLSGLTVAGSIASVLECLARREISLREPFVSSRHIVRSSLVIVGAGPYILLNEALAARRQGRISGSALVSCAFTSALWALAVGIFVVGLASRAGLLLT